MIVMRMMTRIKSRKCQGAVLFIVSMYSIVVKGEGVMMMLMILIGDW